MVYTVTHKASILSGPVLLGVITLYTRYGGMSLFLYNILYLLNYSFIVSAQNTCANYNLIILQ